MSLINKMLQDLEKRRSHQEQLERTVISQLIAPERVKAIRKIPWRYWAWGVVIVIAILLSVFLIWGGKEKANIIKAIEKLQSAPEMLVQQIEKKADHQEVISLHDTAAILQSIQVDHQPNESIIQLTLDHQVHYQFSVGTDHESFILTLANTTMPAGLSIIQPDEIIISAVATSVQNDWQLVIHVKSGTEVRGLQFKQDLSPVLLLTLYHPDVTNPQAVLQKTVVPLTPNEIAQQQYDEAISSINAGQFEEGVSELKNIISNQPDFLSARKALITLYLQGKQYDFAKALIDESLKISPNYIPYVELDAHLAVSQGHAKQALYLLQQYSPPIEEYPNYYALMAALQQQLGQPNLAVQLYGQLLAIQNDNSTWWLGLGIALESSSRPNAAIDAYEHAISAEGLSPSVEIYAKEKIRQLGG